MRAIAAVGAMLLVTLGAWAQSTRPIGAGADRHAWVVLGGPDEQGWRLYHIPPRSTGDTKGSSPGVLRDVRGLDKRPDGMTATGDRVYFLLEPREGVRPVRSMWCEPIGFADLWAYMPSGREYTEPPIDDGTPLVVTGTVDGLAATIVDGVPRRLYVLGPAGWDRREVPSDLLEGDVLALGTIDGVDALLVRTGSEVEVRPIDGSPVSRVAIPSETDRVLLVGGGAFALGWESTRLRITRLTENGAIELCVLTRVPNSACAVGIDDPGRIVMVWEQGEESSIDPTGLAPSRSVQVLEVSSWTGREMYRGEANSDGPFPMAQIRGLWAALFMTALVSLVLVIRPDPKADGFTLPDGFALAGPLRRLGGGLADLILALFAGALVTGTPLSTLTLGSLMMSERGQLLVLTAVAIGLVVCTLCEWRFGRSPGKLLVGTRIVGSGGARVSLAGALVRNVCKWLAPPLAFLGVLDPTLRHRGDVLAQAGVVVRLGAPDEGGNGSEG